MEAILSAIVSDLLSRAVSMVIHRYRQSSGAEHKLQQLQSVLLRIDAMVEEAEGRHITNQAMLRQLDMLMQGMYGGHYMLDTFRYTGHGVDGEVRGGRRRTVPLSRLGSAKRRVFVPGNGGTGELQSSALDAESVRKLEKMLGDLEMMIGDMEEFAMFLEGYPRIFRQPRSTYLILDRVMFGRHMEKETIINFLLCSEAAGDGRPGVLPITGAARVGKSTLVEHVILDERVRGHFASIVHFTGDELGAGAGNMAAFRSSGVIKHQDVTAPSCGSGRSLAVIELSGDMDEETWRRLYSSATTNMVHGSKIIITSRSDNIVTLGTSQAVRLKLLPQEAYWYFFKSLAFGAENPDDHPELASMGMEIAVLLNGTFLGANIVGSLMRDDLSAPFWRKVLQCLRTFTRRHLLMHGEHPNDRLQRGEPVYLWRMARSPDEVVVCGTYQKPSAQRDVPKLTATDVIRGSSVPHQEKFRAVAWRSNVPPCYTYLTTYTLEKAGCSVVGKKRPRHVRV
ncbi:hypothetical protein ACP4OV_024553 [Aristida adscensionis]